MVVGFSELNPLGCTLWKSIPKGCGPNDLWHFFAGLDTFDRYDRGCFKLASNLGPLRCLEIDLTSKPATWDGADDKDLSEAKFEASGCIFFVATLPIFSSGKVKPMVLFCFVCKILAFYLLGNHSKRCMSCKTI